MPYARRHPRSRRSFVDSRRRAPTPHSRPLKGDTGSLDHLGRGRGSHRTRRRLRIIAGTLTPFLTLPVAASGYQDAHGEVVREEVDQWILTSGAFDGVINFAKAVASPSDPRAINPVYDSGDHLHPNDEGYQVMGDLIPLRLLLRHGR